MKIGLALFSYLLGAIPSGYILFYLSEKKDIRKFGSRSTGATNVLRLKGWKLALPVVAIDIGKGIIPVLTAQKFVQDNNFALICAFLAVLGHCFPVYIKFRGGKGVATTLGIYALVAFKPFLLSLAVFLVVVVLSRHVSLGSLLATLGFPLFVLLLREQTELAYLGLALFLLIAYKHRENILRLARGQERKFGEKAQ